MEEKTNNETNPKYIWAVLAAVALVAGLILFFQKNQKEKLVSPVGKKQTGVDKEKVAEIKKFSSEQDFKDYVSKDKSISGYYGGRGGAGGAGLMGAQTSE